MILGVVVGLGYGVVWCVRGMVECGDGMAWYGVVGVWCNVVIGVVWW